MRCLFATDLAGLRNISAVFFFLIKFFDKLLILVFMIEIFRYQTLAAIENCDNRLVECQPNMADRVEPDNSIQLFSCVFLSVWKLVLSTVRKKKQLFFSGQRRELFDQTFMDMFQLPSV